MSLQGRKLSNTRRISGRANWRTPAMQGPIIINSKWKACLGLLILFALLRVEAQTGASKLDVPKLIRSAQLNGEAMSKQVFDYSWKSKTKVRQFNKRGRLLKEVEQDHEVYPSPGLTYVVQKLVKENGLPLSAKRAVKEQKRVDAELMQAELAQALFHMGTTNTENNTGCPVFGIWTVLNGIGGKETSLGVSDFLCFAEFFSPRLEVKDGRDTVILHFRPRGGLIPLAKEKTPFARLVGVMWVDLKDKVVSHIEAWPAENPLETAEQNSSLVEAPIVFDDMRLPDGMWVRRTRYIDTRKDPLAFNGLNLEWKQEFGSYLRYFTEFKDYKVEEPKELKEPKPPGR
jgi:hypothetical protein